MDSHPKSPPPPPGNIVFFSVSKDQDLVHSYNGGGHDLQALAQDWLRNAKRHHVWHSHTEADKTFGFLMRDGYTFFAIDDDAGAGNAEMLAFLERLREAYENAHRKGKIDGEVLNWVLRVGSGGNPRNGSKNDGTLKIEAFPGSPGGVISMSRSLSSRLTGQQRATKLWWRRVKIVAAVDVLLCLTMLAIWLVVCGGFQCLS
ncbi:phytolongin Phyl1.2-like [Zingiber officinale]|uniref:phytolongin Phyl1.2-like n=1 Tax=Zingiber officinale TaxID=94328 RepID=UPI001C4AC1C5|nr:phytolongin Phyl1.2-like [Zingiber officinale]